MGKLSPAVDAIYAGLRSGELVGHSVGGIKSSTFRSRKATVSRARCERQKPTLGYPEYVWK